ncbi:MAG TPA: carboxypeptidase regulatory-like domain-containing protein [Gemmatimonadaceae bacterium]|jgi:hypothetical protein|nr:carboxypeptidase regulatory-like domain-containing protein [Gemmatimonadaceae bacterium]
MSKRYISLAAVGLAMGGPLAAQAPVALATVRGVVLDSLHARPLVGASISVDGTAANGISDSLGQFHIDSVPAGTRQIAVYHPLLDSLGVGLYTAPMAIPPGVETVIALAVPSRQTLMAHLCAGDSAARVLVVGQVLDVDTDTPVAGATAIGSVVAMVLVQGHANNQVTLERGTQTRQSKTDGDGRFHVCLPSGGNSAITATLGNSITAAVPLDVATGLSLVTLRVSRADSAATSNRSVLTGNVQSADGKPVDGATIEILWSGANTSTARNGAFHLNGAPSGTQLLTVRHVGFAEATRVVDVSSKTTRTVTIVLQPQVAVLPKVDVKVQALLVAAAYDRTGFNKRKQFGVGQFVTAERIEAMNAGNATQLLQGVPGVRLLYGSRGVRVVSARSVVGFGSRGCTRYIIDGILIGRGLGGDDQILPQPGEIIGIEVYQPSESIDGWAPSGCLTVMVWTKAELGIKR